MQSLFWQGSEDIKGGQCLVAWKELCNPTYFGGLGVHNLKALNDDLN
jgi:hypothetical protein